RNKGPTGERSSPPCAEASAQGLHGQDVIKSAPASATVGHWGASVTAGAELPATRGTEMSAADRIRLARRTKGLSQAALAELIGVQRSAVTHWESRTGKRPTVEHLIALARTTKDRKS